MRLAGAGPGCETTCNHDSSGAESGADCIDRHHKTVQNMERAADRVNNHGAQRISEPGQAPLQLQNLHVNNASDGSQSRF